MRHKKCYSKFLALERHLRGDLPIFPGLYEFSIFDCGAHIDASGLVAGGAGHFGIYRAEHRNQRGGGETATGAATQREIG